MVEKIMNVYDGLSDYMNGFFAMLLTILIVLFSIGLGVGVIVLTGWVVMSVYNILAMTFNWPTFSIWFWIGAMFIINWLKKGIVSVKIKGKMKD